MSVLLGGPLLLRAPAAAGRSCGSVRMDAAHRPSTRRVVGAHASPACRIHLFEPIPHYRVSALRFSQCPKGRDPMGDGPMPLRIPTLRAAHALRSYHCRRAARHRLLGNALQTRHRQPQNHPPSFEQRSWLSDRQRLSCQRYAATRFAADTRATSALLTRHLRCSATGQPCPRAGPPPPARASV